jgi:hypothetical protein
MDSEQLLAMTPPTGAQPLSQRNPAVSVAGADRRSCLRLLVSLLGVLSLGRSLGPDEGALPAADLESWLQHFDPSRLGDPMALSQLGASYLASHPAEREPEHLARLIVRGRSAPMVSVLIENIAHDWSRHDVTQVQGWVLSRTEARICAMVHLMGGRPG